MFVLQFATLTNNAILQQAIEKLPAATEEWEQNIWQFIIDWFNPTVQTITVHTSGSTGTPKAIAHAKQHMLHSAALTCGALGLKAGNHALLCLPVNKIGGMMMVIRSLYLRMDLYCLKPTTTPLAQLDETHFDFAAFTPMQLHSAFKDYGQFTKAGAIGNILLGGESISAETLQLITRKFDNPIYATFGMTETISHIALKRLNGKNAAAHFKMLEGIGISTDKEGRLIIEAPALGQPHLLTNDLVKIVSATEFDWLGRTDNVINSGGVKIHPEEIEQQLQPHIEPAFFIGALPDERTGQKLVLAIEMTTLSAKDKAELQELFAGLDKLHRPKSVLLFTYFERTPNGKIKRKETLARYQEEVVI
jgi:O-succinylbenzoic acid--CoA ligase